MLNYLKTVCLTVRGAQRRQCLWAKKKFFIKQIYKGSEKPR